MWVLIIALCQLTLEVPGRVTKIFQTENGQKVEKFERIYRGNYRY